MTRNSVSRFQVVTNPAALPSACAVCGIGAGPVGGKEIEFVDFGISYEFYGAFYLCERCVYEIADKFNCMSPQDSINLVGKAKDLFNELEKANEKIASLEDALGSALISGLSITVDSSGNVLHHSITETNSSTKQ